MEKKIKKINNHFMVTFVYFTMGTAFTSQIVLTENPAPLLRELEKAQRAVEQRLEAINQNYSPYIESSELVQYNQGKLNFLEVSEEFQFVIASCFSAKLATHSAFNAEYNDTFEPSGFVKGWAIETILKEKLEPLFKFPEVVAVNLIGGGDMQMSTKTGSNWTFQIGISSPFNRQKILQTFSIKTGSIATSGISERGEHIKGRVENSVQTSVLGEHLQETDVWATALMVNPGLRLPPHLKALIINQKGEIQHAQNA
jgi:thiamine biosynthesis lipoprotein